jgi:hypothetical protein
MRRASNAVLGRLQPAVAIVLIAAFATWQPAMLVTMARPPAAAAHGAHDGQATHGAGQHHHALPLRCCSLCALACAGTPAMPGAPAAVVSRAPDRVVSTVAHAATPRRAAWPHRFPFSVGPPTLRLA